MRRILIEMTYAIQDGRILVFDASNAPGNTLVDSSCQDRSLQCVVEDITSCAAYVTKHNSVTHLKKANGSFQDIPPLVMAIIIKKFQLIGLQVTGAYVRYWWRSQMYGYIMRPRRNALARMLEMRMNSTLQISKALRRNAASQVCGLVLDESSCSRW